MLCFLYTSSIRLIFHVLAQHKVHRIYDSYNMIPKTEVSTFSQCSTCVDMLKPFLLALNKNGHWPNCLTKYSH